jgi:hypothetical protein
VLPKVEIKVDSEMLNVIFRINLRLLSFLPLLFKSNKLAVQKDTAQHKQIHSLMSQQHQSFCFCLVTNERRKKIELFFAN